MTIEQVRNLLKKGNKYNAVKTPCSHGHIHDSVKEAGRCDELHLLLSLGKITDLEFQKPYLIIPALYKEVALDEVYVSGKKKGQKKTKRECLERAVYYKADFVYYDKELDKTVIEDSKGKRTKDYILKRKLMRHQHCNENTIFIET